MKIFPLLDPTSPIRNKLLSPMVQMAVLAKQSRSPGSVMDILNDFDESKGAEFQKKWVQAFGHKAVGDLATIPVCFEGVSIIASKFLERWARPGCCEKSTRMQKFSGDSFVVSDEVSTEMCNLAYRSYETYDRLLPRVRDHLSETTALNEKAIERKAFDICRGLLPAGTATNLALVACVRDLVEIIQVAKVHPLKEIRTIGGKLQESIMDMCGPVIEACKGIPWMEQWEIQQNPTLTVPSDSFHRPVMMIKGPKVRDQKVFFEKISVMHGMDPIDFAIAMNERPADSEVPDVFKGLHYSFRIITDYGSFRDLQRHRRCDQVVFPLTTDFGFDIPDEIKYSAIGVEYEETLEQFESHPKRQIGVLNDQYAIPLAFKNCSVFSMDAKELYYICELRTKPQGHINYRRIAWDMFLQASQSGYEHMRWCRAVNPNV